MCYRNQNTSSNEQKLSKRDRTEKLFPLSVIYNRNPQQIYFLKPFTTGLSLKVLKYGYKRVKRSLWCFGELCEERYKRAKRYFTSGQHELGRRRRTYSRFSKSVRDVCWPNKRNSYYVHIQIPKAHEHEST
ncbi:unnamed protein product [Rhizophagus irregularis]|nr:unnamed protein product [Rhizophagus irregularis]